MPTLTPAAHPARHDNSPPVIRPVQSDDRPGMQQYLETLGADRRRLRFHGGIHPASARLLSHLTQADGCGHIALVAVLSCNDVDLILGEASCVRSADGQGAEFAISVAEVAQGSGLAQRLLQALLVAAEAAGIACVVGEVEEANTRMARFVTRAGFEPCGAPDGGVQRWARTMTPAGRRVRRGPARGAVRSWGARLYALAHLGARRVLGVAALAG